MRHLSLPAIIALVLTCSACAPVVGAGAAGAAYEYQNKQQIEKLEQDFRSGRIDRQEYLRRKQAIEGGSVIY